MSSRAVYKTPASAFYTRWPASSIALAISGSANFDSTDRDLVVDMTIVVP